jgi:predicted PurR-regulated permease PerM
VLYAPAKAIVRIVLIVVGVILTLYLLYLLRKPIGWLLVAAFLAVALSGPVNWLNRKMRRGFAIAVVYLALLAIPLMLIALIVPPLITEANNFAENLPKYSQQVTDFVQGNSKLRKLNEDYGITEKLQQEAEKLPERLGGAAKTLSSVGVGLVNSIFALVTILILTAFMLGGGHRWRDLALSSRPDEQRERLERSLDHIGAAVGGYVAGAMTVALIAGIFTYLVLSILGVPFSAPLAVMAALFSLIPLVGATIAAVIIGVVTVFNDFPADTVVWIIWAIVYQQIENNVIQPQIQKRTVNVHPFITIVAVLFGSTLLGVLGAVVAIPIAASIQILLREYWDWHTLSVKEPENPEPDPPPPPAGAGDPAAA